MGANYPSNARLVTSIFGEILGLSRFEADKLDLEWISFSLSGVITDSRAGGFFCCAEQLQNESKTQSKTFNKIQNNNKWNLPAPGHFSGQKILLVEVSADVQILV